MRKIPNVNQPEPSLTVVALLADGGVTVSRDECWVILHEEEPQTLNETRGVRGVAFGLELKLSFHSTIAPQRLIQCEESIVVESQ